MNTLDTIIDRSKTPSAKYNKTLISSFANNEDARPYWVADMDFRSPQPVLDAIKKELDDGILGYPSFNDTKRIFTSFALKRHNWEIDPSLVVISPGLLASVALLIELYSEEGDTVILPFPSYKPFVSILEGLNRTIIPWNLPFDRSSSSFHVDMDSLERLCAQHDPSILLFCSPHNPTGIVFSRQQIFKIATIAKEHDMMVISDEIHADLVYPDVVHTPFNTVSKEIDLRCATCMAPSKTFNIAGEHFSVIVCSSVEMRRKVSRRQQSLHIAADLLATVSARAAYQHGSVWLDQVLIYLQHNIEVIRSTLKQNGSAISLVVPSASFIAFLDCSAIYDKVALDALNHPDIYKDRGDGGLLSRFFGVYGNVAMNDGTWFGDGYEKFVRFNFACPSEKVIEGINGICTAERSLS
ncbi:MAG: MalY/PatB family protein [Sphaerochaetaceae bacterium]